MTAAIPAAPAQSHAAGGKHAQASGKGAKDKALGFATELAAISGPGEKTARAAAHGGHDGQRASQSKKSAEIVSVEGTAHKGALPKEEPASEKFDHRPAIRWQLGLHAHPAGRPHKGEDTEKDVTEDRPRSADDSSERVSPDGGGAFAWLGQAQNTLSSDDQRQPAPVPATAGAIRRDHTPGPRNRAETVDAAAMARHDDRAASEVTPAGPVMPRERASAREVSAADAAMVRGGQPELARASADVPSRQAAAVQASPARSASTTPQPAVAVAGQAARTVQGPAEPPAPAARQAPTRRDSRGAASTVPREMGKVSASLPQGGPGVRDIAAPPAPAADWGTERTQRYAVSDAASRSPSAAPTGGKSAGSGGAAAAVRVTEAQTHFQPAATLPVAQVAERLLSAAAPVQAAGAPVLARAAQASLPAAEMRPAAESTRPGAGQPVRVLQIHLEPVELGHVQITMRLAAGGLELHVEASEAGTARMLHRDKEALAELLRSGGYDLAGSAVRVTHVETPQAMAGQQQPGSGGFNAAQQGGADAAGGRSGDRPQPERDAPAGRGERTYDEDSGGPRRGRGGIYL